MKEDKKIRISEENRRKLHKMKDADESYDDVIEKLLEEHWKRNREELFDRMEEKNEKKDREDLVSLDELDCVLCLWKRLNLTLLKK